MLTHKFTVAYPIDYFTPEKLSTLKKIVKSKENLLKTALDANSLSIRTTKEMIRFPWFTLEDESHAAYYVQFVWTLCDAIKSERPINTLENDDSINPKKALEDWLVSLGMEGHLYEKARKLLLKNFTENAGGQNQ